MLNHALTIEQTYQLNDSSSSQHKDRNDRVEQHLIMVKRIAFHLKHKLPEQVQLEDLIQAGMLGLIEAAKKFDSEQGASFETYAGIRIRGAMLDEIRKNDWTPRSVHRNTRKVSEVISRIENQKGRQANSHEIAQELGVSQEEYQHILMDTTNHRVLSFEDYGINDESIIDNIPNNQPTVLDKLHRQDLTKKVANAVKELPKRESLVMALYYEEELNLREIGAILGVSESRVSQIHSQAVARLQVKINSSAEF